MKIHILFEFVDGPWGGGNQFLKALRNEFIDMGVYSDNPINSDAILFNSHHELDKVYRLKIKYPEKVFIHRLDGPVQVVRGYDEGVDKKIFTFNEVIAQGTVYQSSWIKQESIKLGLKSSKEEAVILNAPDKKIFNRMNKNSFSNVKLKLIATSWSGNLRKGFDVYEWLDSNLNFDKYEMTFVGNSPIVFKNITHIEPQPSQRLAQILKNHDIYITASKFEPCSNALLEAMHCGLPAIAYNNGGNSQIIGMGGKLFLINDEIINAINEIEKNYDLYSQGIILPDIAEVAKAYYDFIKVVFEKEKKKNNLKKISFFKKLKVYKMIKS